MRALTGFTVMAGLISSAPAQATGCLDRATLTAARLNEFSTMMMAVNLRCKAIGTDLSESFEAMQTVHRPAFSAADRRLRAFFADKPKSFEAYSTRMGNRYGGGATDPANCQRFDKVARDLAAKPDTAALGKVVFTMIAIPHIEGAACPAP
jgi:hypothetical protein